MSGKQKPGRWASPGGSGSALSLASSRVSSSWQSRGGSYDLLSLRRRALPDVLRKRQADLIARLPADPQRAGLQLDVDQTELRHVAWP